jgi:hypothetical protein
MEFVKVLFPASRRVNVDQAPQGLTGEVIRVQAGIHRFDLGTPRNYTPSGQRLPVSGTTLSTPLEIVFTPVALGAAAAGADLTSRAAPPPAARSRSAATKGAKRRKKPRVKKKAGAGVRRDTPKSSATGRRRRRRTKG